jgi:hypothetical protein
MTLFEFNLAMKSNSKKTNNYKQVNLNDNKADELFNALYASYKKEADDRLYWANKAMKEYLKKEKTESEIKIFSKIKALIDANNGDISKFPAVQELFEYNIFPELNGLIYYIKCDEERGETDLYKIGRKGILEYIITCVENEPINGDYYTRENKQVMIKSGENLNKSGGMTDMQDDLVWSFIPKRYKGEIDRFWDGIGEWIA